MTMSEAQRPTTFENESAKLKTLLSKQISGMEKKKGGAKKL